MRAETKVYMSREDMYRIQQAARLSGDTVSSFLRRMALQEADRLAIPRYRSVLEGQQEMLIVVEGGR